MAEANPNSRLEAFSDGVFAIALTLLVLDIKVPSSDGINSTQDLWRALGHLGPSLFAFVLSFTIILITWVNHHGMFKLVSGSSAAFVYANGFMLLTVVLFPVPTALLGTYLFTDAAAPAVVIYDGVNALQAVSWILVTTAALSTRLTRDGHATLVMRENRRFSYFAFAVYSLLALIAFWFPLAVAVVTTALWAFWLVYGFRRFNVQES
jgi:uncharacterized membrane protein